MDEQSERARAPTEHADGEWRAVDQRDINEQLILSGLREQELADTLGRHVAFTDAITGSLSEGIYALDSEDRLTLVNPAAERLLGWTQAELLGKHLQEVNAFRHLDAPDTPVPIAAPGGHAESAARDRDLVCVRRDGTTFPVVYIVTPLGAEGAHAGLAVTFRDVTAERALEQAREEYVSLIAHDLRNPLTTIIVRAELLHLMLRRQGMDREAESAQAILTSGQKMNRMLTDLQEQTRLESGRATILSAPTSLNPLLACAIDQIRMTEEDAPIVLEAAVPVNVAVDAGQIERVMLNLLTNARKYSSVSDPIVVRLSRDDTHAVISIADQGIGIAEAGLPHLFEKYYRTNHDGQVEGLGLGLYISRLIIEAHGGRLWAESVIGVGSTFYFTLPLAD